MGLPAKMGDCTGVHFITLAGCGRVSDHLSRPASGQSLRHAAASCLCAHAEDFDLLSISTRAPRLHSFGGRPNRIVSRARTRVLILSIDDSLVERAFASAACARQPLQRSTHWVCRHRWFFACAVRLSLGTADSRDYRRIASRVRAYCRVFSKQICDFGSKCQKIARGLAKSCC